MTIIVTGGGSGGHITPILAVAAELKQLEPTVTICYIIESGDGLVDIPTNDPNIDMVYTVPAGKFRRYHGEGWKQILDIKTGLLNVRDAFKVLAGVISSYRLLRRLKPDALFIKGGFVGVPVGLAAVLLHIPFMTHDSDAIPGLANRIIARWATTHAVALAANIYPYPAARTVTVGVPISNEYHPVTPAERTAYRAALHLPENGQVILVTGGGLGAQRLNEAMLHSSQTLLTNYPLLQIVMTVGRANEAVMNTERDAVLSQELAHRVTILGYTTTLHTYSAASDIVICRAGATALAEFAAQGRACIVVPNPFLTAGHQLKNAAYMANLGAVKLVNETNGQIDAKVLVQTVSSLLDSPSERVQLGQAFHATAKSGAAKQLAMLLLEQAKAV
jgi:UDP-N-acetylglucosamine--N-acetylmuramyl-(pentapeptide) pyrophosphoryl-undecaprenol N-acetylglucosamine transferase